MMKTKIIYTFACFSLMFLLGCDTEPESLDIDTPNTYSDQYYANLRAYKKTDHQIFYGWYAAYSHLEGVVADYKQPASYGERIAGLPDSLDIVSLWMGIPSLKRDDSLTTYNPIAYEDMHFVRDVKGTRFVVPEITRMERYDWLELNDEGIIKYGDYLLRMVLENDLDGLDLDYEPEGDWISGEPFGKLVEYLGQYLGPLSENPDKLLIIDYYNQAPPSSVEPYINYLINQAYTQGRVVHSAGHLQTRYNQVTWCPPSKFIVTENFGEWWENGGSPFTEADGNTMTADGRQMYSLEGMARWNPTQGQKGGFGAFYFDRDYNNYPPYNNVRQGIQIANPVVR